MLDLSRVETLFSGSLLAWPYFTRTAAWRGRVCREKFAVPLCCSGCLTAFATAAVAWRLSTFSFETDAFHFAAELRGKALAYLFVALAD